MRVFSRLKMSGVDRALDERNRILAAIETQREKLSGLIRERIEAERALQDAETAAALGEETDPDGARKRVDRVMVEIERVTLIIRGLRSRLLALAPSFDAERKALRDALPGHIQKIRDDFAEEWRKGVAAFGALLGKRTAIQSRIGYMDLPEPVATSCELPAEISTPWDALDRLTAALEHVGSWQARNPAGFDASAVYVITHAATGLEPGTPIMDASLDPGLLAKFVGIEYAVPYGQHDWNASICTANQAVLRANADAQSDTLRRDAEDARRSHERNVKDAPPAGPAWMSNATIS